MLYFGKRFTVTYTIPNSGGAEQLYGSHDDLDAAIAERDEAKRISPNLAITVHDQETNTYYR